MTVVKWIYTIIFIVAVLFILLAAFNFITSKGDQTKVQTAKKQLLYAVIGIAVALLSYGVVNLVQNSLQSGLQQ
jgi:NAD/NADP transhydrogenase beta subunit